MATPTCSSSSGRTTILKKYLILLAIVSTIARVGWGVERRVENFKEGDVEIHLTIKEFVKNSGIPFPEIVFAQGILETGWFNKNNPVFFRNKNWLGLKCAQHRETYCVGTKYGHAIFESYGHCLADYVLWYQKYSVRYEANFGKIDTEEKYYDFLLKWHYAEDKHYIQKLKKIVNLIKTT